MAYLKDTERKCQDCKVRRATKDLFNRANANLGSFCGRCAKEALRKQEGYESGPDLFGTGLRLRHG